MYRVLVLPAAARELAELDKPVGRRIVKRINWMAEHLEGGRLEALTGDLSGFYKLRVGDYPGPLSTPARRTDAGRAYHWAPEGDLPSTVGKRR